MLPKPSNRIATCFSFTLLKERIQDALGLDKVMFEATDPEVFGWYVKNCGPEVNLFVDHSQIVHLDTLRRGIWGTKDLWGRVLTYKPPKK